MEKVSCFLPETLDEALKIMNENQCIPMAGGSDLMVANKRTIGVDPTFDKPVIIIRNLAELKKIYITFTKSFTIFIYCNFF